MKKIFFVFSFLQSLCLVSNAQLALFNKVLSVGQAQLSVADEKTLEKVTLSSFIKEKTIVKINPDALRQGRISLNVNSQLSAVAEINTLKTISTSEYSLFGRLLDGTGIFFTIDGNKVVSKFYIRDEPYSLLPLNDEYHVLIQYNKNVDNGRCGLDGSSFRKSGDNESTRSFEDRSVLSDDDDGCRMRVLLVFTTEAQDEMPIALDLAARSLEDESNLAYQQSQVDYQMEIARVVQTNYVETTNNQNSTEYGVTSSYPGDLLNLRSGAGLLSNIPTLRNNYHADVVVMVRSAATNAAQGFYGIALGVPTGMYDPSDNNAFALISTEYMIGGRFTFAHEIGHIQGARHDNHSALPVYARGYVYATGGTLNRTIMAVGCGGSAATGCRAQFFSNPTLSIGGVPIGVTNQFDNVRRINETATYVLDFRLTPNSILLSSETFGAGILARQIAKSDLSTNNNAIIVSANSNVSFRAGNEITLLPGFSAVNGSKFIAHIGSCSDAPFQANRKSANTNVSPELEVNKKEFILFPNPGKDYIRVSRISGNNVSFEPSKNNLEKSFITQVNIYDQSGNIKMKQAFAKNIESAQLNISNLQSGIYYLEIILKNGTRERHPLIIKH